MTSGAEDEARIEGVRPVLEVLRAGRRRVLEVALPADASTPGLRELVAALREAGIEPARSEGSDRVWARAEPFPEETFEALLDDARPRRLVALDGITNVGNLGSIARSANAAGATGLVLELRRAAPVGAGALRASAGAIEHLRVGRAPSLPRALELARGEGLTLLAADPGGSYVADLPQDALTGEWVWIFGSEDRGLRRRVLDLADHRVGVPMLGSVTSLGVAASAAYLLLRSAEARNALAKVTEVPQ